MEKFQLPKEKKNPNNKNSKNQTLKTNKAKMLSMLGLTKITLKSSFLILKKKRFKNNKKPNMRNSIQKTEFPKIHQSMKI